MKKTASPLILLTAALLLAAGGARAAGTSGASFLRVGWGARPAAMGEAFTAAADDVDAVYWTPAGLNYVKRLQQTFGHNSWLEGTNFEHAAFALRRSTASVLGVGIAYLNTGDIERGNKYGYTEGYYSAADMSVLLSYARRLKKIHTGVTLKVVQERIESSEAKAFAADAGAIYEFSPKLRLGATLKNLGTGLTLTKEAAPLPMGLRAGAALQFSKNLLLTSDASLPFDDSLSLHFGAEYIYPSPVKGVRLALRGGFKTASMAYLGATSALTLGFGAEAGAVGLDYALSPYGDLGLTHRVSLKIKFDSLSAKADSDIVIQKGKRTIRRGAAEVYAETLQWFEAKAASEKLSTTEQAAILKRVIEKFSALGVDVSRARQLLGAGQ